MRPKLVSLAVGLITAIGLSAAPLTTAGAAPAGAPTTSPADPASRITSVTQVTSETSQVTTEVTSHNTSGAIDQTIVQTTGTGSPTEAVADTTLVRHVTLVTGDRVRLAYDGDEAPRVSVTPAEGRQQMTFAVKRKGEEVSVVPADAAPLVANGRVDPRLFQVTSLVEQGYDDASTDQLPLIAEQSPGTNDTLLGLVSIAPLKKNAGKLWASLTDTVGATLDGSALEGLGNIVTSVKLERLWLDGRVEAPRRSGAAPDPGAATPLARTTVPANGKVRVALVDSGVDATHPDLQGAIVAQRDFTDPRGRATDGMGHGTHVASAIVGNGAASNGRYRGLAAGTGTELVVAKVLDDHGTGAESDVIAGMEWAVSQGARIVNMSLGRLERSDGTDPVSQAIDRLSSRALFVAAVGNLGPEKMAITSPGAADHTLTVAAFDHTGKTAEFSSRGPRPGDFAAKPDIAALGVNRVGARAEGTTFGVALSDSYTVMSGTSMAAPLVTGAAALLARARPTWTPSELKAALMGTAAAPVGDASVDEQGAGRLDIRRALRQQVFAVNPSVSNYLQWPHRTPVRTFVTYRNRGDRPVTLKLAFDGDTQGFVRLDSTSVMVPARGETRVGLTIDPRKGKSGLRFATRLIATGPDVVVRTPVTAYLEPESYDVRARIIDRSGRVLDDPRKQFQFHPTMVDVKTGREYPLRRSGGQLVARVPAGRYTLTEIVQTPRVIGPPSSTLVSVPALDVRRDTTVTLDTRQAKPVRTTVDAPSAVATASTFGVVETVGGKSWETLATAGVLSPMYALPTPTRVTDRSYNFVVHRAMMAPTATYELLQGTQGGIPQVPTYRVHDQQLTRVTADFAAPGVAQRGRWYHSVEMPRGIGAAFTADFPVSLPGTRTHLVSSQAFGQRLTWYGSVDLEAGGRPVMTMAGPQRQYSGKTAREVWGRAAFAPHAELFVDEPTGSPTGGRVLGVVSSTLSPAVGGRFVTLDPAGTRGTLTLARDGKVVGRSGPDLSYVETQVDPAATAGRYTATLQASSALPWSAYATQVRGRWDFAAPAGRAGQQADGQHLMNVRVAGPFDTLGRARAGHPARLTLHIDGGSGAVSRPEFAMSYDDGRTWQTVPVTKRSDRVWTAQVAHPANASFASWRLQSRDAKGNAVDLTVIRSYGLTR